MSTWPRWLRVIAWMVGGLLALMLVLAIFLAFSIAIDARGAAERLDEVANTTIPGEVGPDVLAYVATPSTTPPHPVVIMIHEFWGLNPDIVSKADLLAEEGYLVVAPNVFRGRTTGYLPSAIYQVASTPAEEVNQDIDATLAWIETQQRADAGRVGITGFCFGGRSSLLYSLHNPSLQATSVFYGEPVIDPERLATLGGPVLGVFGGADTSIPLGSVRAFARGLDEAGVESTVTVYPNQPHAFMGDAEEIASDPVQAKAWEQMVRFFDGALKEGEPG
ncbi:MAG TPA: dienelactone hydrolase family protein, partial [Coriobacteriia bacterium]|nr:dienelactone hydrolase family protein [Coriobacteriia bacterium]